MFTGLIESTGRIEKIKSLKGTDSTRVKIRLNKKLDMKIGDSIAVNGCCLTVVKNSKKSFSVEVSPETLSRTSLRGLKENQIVNLEAALRASDRLGGHFVLGHVDAVGSVESLQKVGKFYKLSISFPQNFAALLIEKGSIAVDGISLTVNSCSASTFEVMIIPHTWSETILSRYHKGLAVNLEFDILGKYILRSQNLLKEGSDEKRKRA